MAAISLDLRKRILEALSEDSSSPRVAERFKVSASFVRKLRCQVRATNNPAAGHAPGKVRLIQGRHEDVLRRLVRTHPDATLLDLAAALKKEVKVEVSETTMWRSLRRLGMTVKKRSSTPSRGTART
jgi:putative transposase